LIRIESSTDRIRIAATMVKETGDGIFTKSTINIFIPIKIRMIANP
jgi:hypothetical protein